MSPPHARRTITLPPDLDALRILHAARLPTLSHLATAALRAALAQLDVALPPPPGPSRTSAATAASAQQWTFQRQLEATKAKRQAEGRAWEGDPDGENEMAAREVLGEDGTSPGPYRRQP